MSRDVTKARDESMLDKRWGLAGVSPSRRVAVSAIALVVAAGLAGVAVVRGAPEGRTPSSAAVAVDLVGFDGQTFTLAEYRGTPLVVNFWASWCPSCAAEMPAFESVYQEFKGDVEFVGINNNDNREAALELARSTGVTYRLAEDPRGEAFAALEGVGMPTTIFIDGSGGVVETVAGGLSGDQLTALIEEHLEITR